MEETVTGIFPVLSPEVDTNDQSSSSSKNYDRYINNYEKVTHVKSIIRRFESLNDLNEIKDENLSESKQDFLKVPTVSLERNVKFEKPKEHKPETKEIVEHYGSMEGQVSFEKDSTEKHYDNSLYQALPKLNKNMDEIDTGKVSVLNSQSDITVTTNDQSSESSPSLKNSNKDIHEVEEISDNNENINNIKNNNSEDLQLEISSSKEIKMENLLGDKQDIAEDSTVTLERNMKSEQLKEVKPETKENVKHEIKMENLLGDKQDIAEDPTVTLERNMKPEQLKEVKPETKENLKHDGCTEGRVSFEKDHIEKFYDKVSHKRHWIIGAIGRLLGLEFAPINIPISRRLETFGVFFWMSTFLFMGFGSLGLMFYMFFYTQYWWVSLSYLTWYLGDRSICNRGGRRVEWVRNWRLWKHMANFFPAHIIKTAELDPNRNYIMGYHPHGILSAGGFVHYATEGTGFSKVFPGFTPYLLTLAGHFHLPLYREFFLCSGAVSATRESMDYLLGREGSGRALCLVVGGAKESLDCHPGQVILHLSKRKGFCKMALRHGSPLVPMFSFGENEIYDQIHNPEGSLTRRIQNYLQKMIGLAPCVVLGRGIFQYSLGIIPFRHSMYTVVGAPIEVAHVQNPTKEQIVDLHTKYVEALKELYNKYKHKYAADPSVEMQIL